MGMAAPQSSVQCGLWPELSRSLCFETNSNNLELWYGLWYDIL